MIQYHHELFHIYTEQRAKNNNEFCGDSYYITSDDNELICLLADGLGSGEFAYQASDAAVRVVEANPKSDIETLMDQCNEAMIGKRGAAVAIFKVNLKTKIVQYSCVGNIRFFLFPSNEKAIYPMPVSGYLSGRYQKYRVQTFKYIPESRFIFYTDGFVPKQTNKLIKQGPVNEELMFKIAEEQSNLHDDITYIIGSLF